MNLLLDTHTVLWTMLDPSNLSSKARGLIGDPANSLMVSVVSLWEITIKIQIGKLTVPGADIAFILQNLDGFRIRILPVTSEHLRTFQVLPRLHKDPFDRMIIAQAQAEGIPLVTADRDIRQYQLNCLW